jgi:TonB family protein
MNSVPFADFSVLRNQRYAAIGIAAIVHLALFWFFAVSVHFQVSPAKVTELQASFFSPNLGPRQPLAPPLDWQFQTLPEPLVPEPEIRITPDQQGGEGIVADGIRQKLAPRLDPAHLNQLPELPHTLGSVGALALKLRILVLPGGSVGDAQIISSTGEPDIDRLAIETVKNSWHYLPASINGKPIEAWTTVIVRFAAI